MSNLVPPTRAGRPAIIRGIVGESIRRQTTAAILFHHALAERLGLGPTDLKCLDVLRERGRMTASELAAATGLTTGAITGVVARLEDAGYVSRERDPMDGRKQILAPITGQLHKVHDAFKSLHQGLAEALESFDARQLAAIEEFLDRSTELIHRQTGLLRAGAFAPDKQPARGKTRAHP